MTSEVNAIEDFNKLPDSGWYAAKLRSCNSVHLNYFDCLTGINVVNCHSDNVKKNAMPKNV